jgi:2-(1,2-epoxy-1,2-dihydrophenyl)acetyl-CoA isomerase
MSVSSQTFEQIRLDEPAEHVLRITLDRDETLNAYTNRMCDELVAAVTAFERDDALRVLILTGEGRAFSSGGDILEDEVPAMAAVRQLPWVSVLREGVHRVVRTLFECPKPTVVAVNGAAVAGGLTFALACDFRIAGARARLGDTANQIGYLPDEGGAWLFPRHMGYSNALRMTLLSEVYDAERARELGLVNEVVPDDALEERSIAFAQQLAARAPLAVRLAKTAMRRSLTGTLSETLEELQIAGALVNDSADVQEGIRAFQDKREPKFEGR